MWYYRLKAMYAVPNCIEISILRSQSSNESLVWNILHRSFQCNFQLTKHFLFLIGQKSISKTFLCRLFREPFRVVSSGPSATHDCDCDLPSSRLSHYRKAPSSPHAVALTPSAPGRRKLGIRCLGTFRNCKANSGWSRYRTVSVPLKACLVVSNSLHKLQ